MKLKIALLPGDSIGPNMLSQAVKCLQAIEETFNHQFIYREAPIGAVSEIHYGTALPKRTLNLCVDADAILFGITSNKGNGKNSLHKLRDALGFHTHVQPIKPFYSLLNKSPLKKEIVAQTHFLIYTDIVNESTVGAKKINTNGYKAKDTLECTEENIARISHLAFKAAKNRDGKLTLASMDDTLTTSQLWLETVSRIGKSYPEVNVDFMLIEEVTRDIILNPGIFDVILTQNSLGKILLETSNALLGSINVLASKSIAEERVLFAPIHTPHTINSDVNDSVNPIGCILSTALLLEHFGLYEEAMCVREAIDNAIENGIITPDLKDDSPFGTNQIGDYIADFIMDNDDSFRMNDENIDLGKSTII